MIWQFAACFAQLGCSNSFSRRDKSKMIYDQTFSNDWFKCNYVLFIVELLWLSKPVQFISATLLTFHWTHYMEPTLINDFKQDLHEITNDTTTWRHVLANMPSYDHHLNFQNWRLEWWRNDVGLFSNCFKIGWIN